MTLEELYNQIGGDYEDAVKRLRMDKLITKFVVRFLEDTSCDDVVSAYEAGDETALFEASHAAKGVCSNLSLTRIAKPASVITEAMRPGNDDLKAQTDVGALVEELKTAHADTVAAIRAFLEQ